MSAKTDQIMRRLASSIREGSKPKTSPYDTAATVRRVEGGTAWVHIPGGVDETPVKLTISAKPGDAVQVRVTGGRAFLVGNATAPPTDDTTAQRAVAQVGTVSRIVQTVKGVAERTARIAGNTAQYFWHTETGTDTGAHITEIPQEQFEGDPENGGGNLLLRSNGLAVRDGLDELATFAADGSRIGAADGGYIETKADRFRAVSKLGDKYFEVRDLSGQEITLERTGTGGGNRNFYAPNADTSIPPSVTVDGVETSATWIGTPPSTMVQLPFPAPAVGSVILITYTIDSAETVPCFTAGSRGSDGYEGAYSAVIGKSCYAGGEAATAAGIGTTAPGDGQMVVGKYNSPNRSDLFQVGNGTSDNSRSTAFAIGANGEIMTNDQELFGGASWAPSTGVSVASGAWSAALDGYTFQLSAGMYLVAFGADFSSNATGYRMVQIKATSTGAGGNRYTPTARAVDGNNTRLSGVIVLTPTASTEYAMYAYQNSGSALTVAPWVNVIRLK